MRRLRLKFFVFLQFYELFLPPFSRLDVHVYASRLEERRFSPKSDYPLKCGLSQIYIWDSPDFRMLSAPAVTAGILRVKSYQPQQQNIRMRAMIMSQMLLLSKRLQRQLFIMCPPLKYVKIILVLRAFLAPRYSIWESGDFGYSKSLRYEIYWHHSKYMVQ